MKILSKRFSGTYIYVDIGEEKLGKLQLSCALFALIFSCTIHIQVNPRNHCHDNMVQYHKYIIPFLELVLQFTGFNPNVGKIFAVFASSVPSAKESHCS